MDSRRVLADEGIGGIAFCPLAQGRSRSLPGGHPADARAARDPRFSAGGYHEEKLKKIRQLDALAGKRAASRSRSFATLGAAAIPITSALIGASKVSQIEENVPR